MCSNKVELRWYILVLEMDCGAFPLCGVAILQQPPKVLPELECRNKSGAQTNANKVSCLPTTSFLSP